MVSVKILRLTLKAKFGLPSVHSRVARMPNLLSGNNHAIDHAEPRISQKTERLRCESRPNANFISDSQQLRPIFWRRQLWQGIDFEHQTLRECHGAGWGGTGQRGGLYRDGPVCERSLREYLILQAKDRWSSSQSAVTGILC